VSDPGAGWDARFCRLRRHHRPEKEHGRFRRLHSGPHHRGGRRRHPGPALGHHAAGHLPGSHLRRGGPADLPGAVSAPH
ncbi:Cytochrome D ubiquinol oxidase subunit II, partial [Dysosmobacter welbionis]